jgi:predicted nucleic acid-binding protein
MRRCLLDTTPVTLLAQDQLPGKWVRLWKDLNQGTRRLVLFEALIAEAVSRLTPLEGVGREGATAWIAKLKGLPHVEVHHLSDKDALSAGLIKASNHWDLSLVDSLILEVAASTSSLLVTSDHGLRDAAEVKGVEVSFLPFDTGTESRVN